MYKTTMIHYLPELEGRGIEHKLAELQAIYPKLGVCALLPEAEKEKVGLLQSTFAGCKVPLMGAIFPALVKEATLSPVVRGCSASRRCHFSN